MNICMPKEQLVAIEQLASEALDPRDGSFREDSEALEALRDLLVEPITPEEIELLEQIKWGKWIRQTFGGGSITIRNFQLFSLTERPIHLFSDDIPLTVIDILIENWRVRAVKTSEPNEWGRYDYYISERGKRDLSDYNLRESQAND